MTVSVLPGSSNPIATGLTAAGFRSLTSGCGVYGIVDRARLSLTGKDRVRWLNGMITNNIRDLAEGHGVYAFLLNPQGRILGDLYAYNRGESLMLDIDREQLPKVLETLKRYIIMDKVEITDISDSVSTIAIAGPKSSEVLRTAGVSIPDLSPLQFAPSSWREVELTVVRGDNPAVASFAFWLDRNSESGLRAALVDAGAQEVDAGAVEWLRIACGVPRYGQDIHDRDLPQETGQARALNFTKGCYIGQEIVERIRARGNVHRMFAGFYVAGNLPSAGAKIQAEGKDVGELTSLALLASESGELAVALGYVRREAASKDLTAETIPLKVTDLPFKEFFRR